MTKQEVARPSYGIRYLKPGEEIPVAPSGNVLYLDLETYAGEIGTALDVQYNRVRLISFTTNIPHYNRDADNVIHERPVVFVADMMEADPDHWKHVFDYIQSYEYICGHNLAFDLPILVRHGLRYPRRVWDTMIASRVLRNGTQFRHTLKNLVEERLGFEMPKELAASDWADRILTPEQKQYAALDAAVLPLLHARLLDRLEVFRLLPTYELECAVLLPITSMTLNGVGVDVEHWTARSRKAAAAKEAVEAEIRAVLGRPKAMEHREVKYTKKGSPRVSDVNYNRKVDAYNESRQWNLASPKQLDEALQQLGIELPHRGSTGSPITSYEVLVQLQEEHPVFALLINWRDLEKQAGTFGEDWLKNAHPDGRVYPNWWQLGAASGRMTCSGPNMQQVPRKDARKGIVARQGHVFVRADFSQIEARVAAKISGDPVLIELFQKGEDIHAFAAKAVLGKLTVTPEERQIGKSLVFGLLFSMSAPSLRVYCSVNYGVRFTTEEAVVFRDRFFRTFHGLAKWHDRIRKVCNYASEFRTLLGRRRIVKHLAARRNSGNDDDHVNMLGLGLNTPVQGTAADMMKMAVREVWERRDERPDFKLVMLVHDEVVGEVPEEQAPETADWLRGIMIEAGNVVLDPIPCDAAVKIGRTWGG